MASPEPDWILARLDKHHDRLSFTCGKAPLDNFLHSLVTQYEKRRLGRTYVATELNSNRIAGYFTLAASSIDISVLPDSIKKKLPKHPVPVIHLGRLAVDLSFRGRRLGETLLLLAFQVAFETSERIGALAVDVRTIDDDAKTFYVKYGFIELSDDPNHLYLPMKTIEDRWV